MGATADGSGRTIGWIVVAVALLLCSAVSTARAFDIRDYQLIYHESGGVTVFTRGNLVYFVQRGTVTIYRPIEGRFVRLPYDTTRIEGDDDGTRSVDFSKPPKAGPREPPIVVAIRDPATLRLWDEVARQPATRPEFGFLTNDPRRDRAYAVVGDLPDMAQPDEAFDSAVRYLAAVSFDPREEKERRSHQDEIEAAVAAGPEGISRLGAKRFMQAAAVPREVGMTVCSADNRVAFIKQVDGARVRLLVRGRAVGNQGDFGPYGPFDTALFEAPAGRPIPITDPYFLFLPLPGAVKFVRVEEKLWDLGRLWAICGYQ